MGSKVAFVFALGLAGPLCGCGAVDSGVTFVPEAFRQPAHKAEIEQPPDIHFLVRNHMSEIFTAAAEPTDISLSFPVPAEYGGWTTCLKAAAKGVTGRSIGTQTYLVFVEHGEVTRREHVDGAHWCTTETYQSL